MSDPGLTDPMPPFAVAEAPGESWQIVTSRRHFPCGAADVRNDPATWRKTRLADAGRLGNAHGIVPTQAPEIPAN